MTDDQFELVARLCTAAGMLMEDVCPTAILSPSRDTAAARVQVEVLTSAAENIRALIAAAEAVLNIATQHR